MSRPSPRLWVAGLCLALGALQSVPAALADDISGPASAPTEGSHSPLTTPMARTERPADDPPSLARLKSEIEAVWGGRVLRRGITAVHVADAATGAALYSVHADDGLNPASNVKLVSTATVLDALGPGWRYRTRVLGPLPDNAGVVHGSLYLRGMADPTLGHRGLAELAARARRLGITAVRGDIVLSDDLHRDTIASGTIKVSVRASRLGRAPAVTVTPASELIRVVNRAKTRRGRNRLRVRTKMIDEPAGPILEVEVSGRVRPGRALHYRRGVHRRSTFSGYALRAALRAAGIEIEGGVRLAELGDYVEEIAAAGSLPVELAVHESRPMEELVARVNKRSLNHLADRLVMTAAAQRYGGEPSMEGAVKAMREWLERAGVDGDRVVLDTGSGLSYKTELSARDIVRVLRAAGGYQSALPSRETYRRSLSVAGVDGTLRGRFRKSSLRGSVIGKTGTLTGVIALSGFVTSAEGRTLVFSIVTNGNRHRQRRLVRRAHETIVEALNGFLERQGGSLGVTAASPARHGRPRAHRGKKRGQELER